jgi:hypothetical protein
VAGLTPRAFAAVVGKKSSSAIGNQFSIALSACQSPNCER